MPELATFDLTETPPPPPPAPLARRGTYLCAVELNEAAAHPVSPPTCSGFERRAWAFHGRRATCS